MGQKKNEKDLEKRYGKKVRSVNGFVYREKTLQKGFGLTEQDLMNGKFPEEYELCPCGEVLQVDQYGHRLSSRCSEKCRKLYDGKHQKLGRLVENTYGFLFREPELLQLGMNVRLFELGAQSHPLELCVCGQHLQPNHMGKPKSQWCSSECMQAHKARERRESLMASQNHVDLPEEQMNLIVENALQHPLDHLEMLKLAHVPGLVLVIDSKTGRWLDCCWCWSSGIRMMGMESAIRHTGATCAYRWIKGREVTFHCITRWSTPFRGISAEIWYAIRNKPMFWSSRNCSSRKEIRNV